MQKIFLKWLSLIVASAFILTFATSYFVQTSQSNKGGIELIKLKIADVKNQLNTTNNNLKTIEQISYNTSLLKAKTFAKLVYYNPKVVVDPGELEQIRRFLDVDEVHISDAKGILIASIPEKYKNFDMSLSAQSQAFMPALTDPDFAFVQQPMMRGAKDGIFQYAGAARIGQPGIIEIGFRPERIKNAKKLADIKTISDGFRIGKSGSIIVIKDQKIISAGINKIQDLLPIKETLLEKAKNVDNSFKININEIQYVCLSDAWQNYSIIGILPENEMYLSRNSVAKVLLTVNFILFAIIFFLIFTLLQKIVISGIYKVNVSLNKITNGNLEEKVNVQNSQEFEMLSKGINSTVGALKNAIEAEAKRLDEELELAKSIQHSALPNIFPPYPDRKEFDIFASMDTAKEVGGDFYDFFFIDSDHFAFLIADVSGKGIPAALFMMTSKTLIENLSQIGIPPETIIENVNNQICKNNEQGLFVTLFFCVLELSTGKLVCVNAGHNPPLIKKHTGSFEPFKCKTNLVIGAMPGIKYNTNETILTPGDTVFLYTDGVTEALNQKKEFYGDKKLHASLNLIDESVGVERIVNDIRKDVEEFSNGEAQSDDITMLTLRYYSGGKA